MTLGELIEQRGIDILCEEGEFVSDIVVVTEIIDKEGVSRIVVNSGEMTNWIKENGMLDLGHRMTSEIT